GLADRADGAAAGLRQLDLVAAVEDHVVGLGVLVPVRVAARELKKTRDGGAATVVVDDLLTGGEPVRVTRVLSVAEVDRVRTGVDGADGAVGTRRRREARVDRLHGVAAGLHAHGAATGRVHVRAVADVGVRFLRHDRDRGRGADGGRAGGADVAADDVELQRFVRADAHAAVRGDLRAITDERVRRDVEDGNARIQVDGRVATEPATDRDRRAVL